MKKAALIITFLIVYNLTFAQWTELTTGSTTNFNSMFFINTSIGLVVGENGTILKTINGGNNWTQINSGTTNGLNSVEFSSENVGYIVGDGGTILKSIDNGEIWNVQNSTVVSDLVSLSVVNKDIVYVVGDGQSGSMFIILKTNDGGLGWNTIVGGTGGDGLTSIHMIDENIGFYVGLVGHNSRTIDGWNNFLPVECEYMPYTEIYFSSINVGYIVGMLNTIRKTINGGESYSSLTPDLSYDGSYHTVYFINDLEGYIAGDDKIILKTEDAGDNWTTENHENNSFVSIKSIHFPDQSVGYAAGDNGTILKTGGGTGIYENENENTWSLYPNPVENIAVLTFKNPKKECHTLKLYDTQGCLVRTISNITTNKVEIEKRNLIGGLYFFQMNNDRQIRAIGKLMIE